MGLTASPSRHLGRSVADILANYPTARLPETEALLAARDEANALREQLADTQAQLIAARLAHCHPDTTRTRGPRERRHTDASEIRLPIRSSSGGDTLRPYTRIIKGQEVASAPEVR